MDKKTTGIIATLVSVFLCGCPGLCFCLFGAFTAIGKMPYETEFSGVTDTGTLPPTVGYVLICLALILIVIPIAVGFVTLRKKPGEAVVSNEPLPPPA